MEPAIIACETTIAVMKATDRVTIGVAPSDELVIRFSEAWACLPPHGAWVGGYDGGSYVWLRDWKPDKLGLYFGEIFSLHEKYRGRFAVYSEKPVQQLDPSDLDFADPAFGVEFRVRAADRVRVNLIPVDADAGYFRATADGLGSPTASIIKPPSDLEGNGFPVFEEGQAFFVVVSSRDEKGFVASIFDRDAILIVPPARYARHGSADAFSPDSLSARHSPFKLLISRNGQIFRAD